MSGFSRVLDARSSVTALALLACAAGAQQDRAPFDAPVVLVDSNGPPLRALLDFDGDGDTDLLAAQLRDDEKEYRVELWENDGAGGFSSAWTSQDSVFSATQNARLSVSAGDLNGDGLEDFALAAGRTFATFTAAPGLPFLVAEETHGDQIRDVLVVDLDGEGSDEIVLLADDVVRVVWSSGDESAHAHLASTQWSRLIELDTDADALPDFAVFDDGTIEPFACDGQAVGALAPLSIGLFTLLVDGGDVDGDGDDDFAVWDAWGQFQVLRRDGPSHWTLEPAAEGGPAEFLFDVDGDGDLDGVCCGSGGGGGGGDPQDPMYPELGFQSTFEIALNDGTGAFAPSFDFFGLGSQQLAGADDLDGDGDLDLVAGQCVYYGRGALSSDSMPKTGISPFGALAEHLVGDVDLDGDPDLQVSNHGGYHNDGSGRFGYRAHVQGPDPTEPEGIYSSGPAFWGDFTGDGAIDGLYAMYVPGTFSPPVFQYQALFVNNGGAGFEYAGPAAALGEEVGLPDDFTLENHFVADADGDDDLDLFPRSTNTGPAASTLWLNDGTGFFRHVQGFPGEIVTGAADLTGDGRIDLVLSTYSQGKKVLVLRRGLAAGPDLFGPAEAVFPQVAVDVPDIHVELADFNDDGFLDVGYGGLDGEAVVALNRLGLDGVEGFVNAPFADALEPLATPAYVLAADVDLDGATDVIVGPFEKGPEVLRVHLRDAAAPDLLDASSFEQVVDQVADATLLSDVDGDGDLDLVGPRAHVNTTRVTPEAGFRRQLGQGTAGSGEMVPTLGASGPFRVGEVVTLHLTGALSGATSFFAFSAPPAGGASFVDFPVPGATTWVDLFDPGLAVLTVPVLGPAGQAGWGQWNLPYEVPAFLGGKTFRHQAFVLDPGAAGSVAVSNAVDLTYGS